MSVIVSQIHQEQVWMVKCLVQIGSLSIRARLTSDHLLGLLELCLTTTLFRYNEVFNNQTHGCGMDSPGVSNSG